MDPGKVSAVHKWKSPTTKKELQTLLGFTTFTTDLSRTLPNIPRAHTPYWEKRLVMGIDTRRSVREIIEHMCKEPIYGPLKTKDK